MSLYGMMKTGVSGMNAQANRLSTVADNIANSSTNGYKRANTEFSTLVVPSTQGSYNSGGVTTTVRNSVATQGVLQYTTSVTDLAVEGDGFFVVQDAGGQPYLTRAGAFVPDEEGRLVNAAGYQLMGYDLQGGAPNPVANGYDGLEPITISDSGITVSPTTSGSLEANLPTDTAVGESKELSLSYVDKQGERQLLDIEFSKISENTTTGEAEWEIFANGTSFGTVNFNASTDDLTAQTNFTVTTPALAFGQAIDLSFSLSQIGNSFTRQGETNGSEPTSIESVEISNDGMVYAQYADGSFRALYRIPLATVTSPDQLQVLSGNVFAESADSGAVRIGLADEAGLGRVVSGALENSNVDIAEELTSMIESQRSYTANSKVFQTGSELMELLVNLKR